MTQTFDTLNAASDSASDFPSQNWNTLRDTLLSSHSGTARPSYAVFGTLWFNTSSKTIYFYDGASDIPVHSFDTSNHWLVSPMGGGVTTMASMSTLDIGATNESLVYITGSTTITSFGASMRGGQTKICVCSGSFQITHDGTYLVLPGGTNITTSLGDVFGVVCTATGRYRLCFYTQAAAAPSSFSTGDVKATYKDVADSGWIMMDDGTIGSASSSATSRANADTEALFTLLWNKIPDAWCPVSGGRGGSAASDFSANKRLQIPRSLGRVFGVAGSGSSLTTRVLGEYQGAEQHQLTEAQLPSHTHTLSDPGHYHYSHEYSATGGDRQGIGAGGPWFGYGQTTVALTGITIANTGSNAPHNNVQPTTFLNAMIKL